MNNIFKYKNGKFIISEGYESVGEGLLDFFRRKKHDTEDSDIDGPVPESEKEIDPEEEEAYRSLRTIRRPGERSGEESHSGESGYHGRSAREYPPPERVFSHLSEPEEISRRRPSDDEETIHSIEKIDPQRLLTAEKLSEFLGVISSWTVNKKTGPRAMDKEFLEPLTKWLEDNNIKFKDSIYDIDRSLESAAEFEAPREFPSIEDPSKLSTLDVGKSATLAGKLDRDVRDAMLTKK